MSNVTWDVDGSVVSIADHIARAIESKPGPVIAVPGGSTPGPVFAELAGRGLDWAGATLMLTDDRIVPPDHPASNLGKLQAGLGQSGATIVPLEEGMLVPPLDLLWIGMGEDGHIASLFPKMTCADVPGPRVIRTVPDPLPPEAPFPRLSMNMAALASARDMILVARGDAKKNVIMDVLAGRADLPIAQLLAFASAPLTIYWSQT